MRPGSVPLSILLCVGCGIATNIAEELCRSLLGRLDCKSTTVCMWPVWIHLCQDQMAVATVQYIEIVMIPFCAL